MDEKMTDAEREFEEWWAEQPSKTITAKTIWLAADANATDRTARRCVEICDIVDASPDEGPVTREALRIASTITKEFGLD